MSDLFQATLEAEVERHWDGADPAHDIWHLRRVWHLCQRIAAETRPAPDLDLLQAAAALHDLVNLPKDHPERHLASRRSADLARTFLQTQNWPQPRIDATAHAIEAHSFSAAITPHSDEARILQDADRIDALGAIGIARCFAVSGQLGRPLFDGADPLAERRAIDDSRFAVDHFETKLFRIAENLHMAAARAIADQRVQFMRSFLAQLASETSAPKIAPSRPAC